MNVIAFRALLVGPLLFTTSLTDAQEPLAFNQLHVGLSGVTISRTSRTAARQCLQPSPTVRNPCQVANQPGSFEPCLETTTSLHRRMASTRVSRIRFNAQLNRQVDSAAAALAAAWDAGATSGQLLELLTKHLFAIDRDTLDTEDAEHVAGVFARMLDILGIESSGGALNTWMYGFDPA